MNLPRMIIFPLSLLMLAGVCRGEESPKAIFEKRILPIFRSPNPSSCTECHLANLDLKNYILPDSEKTFLSLRDQGLVNLQEPEKSRILKFISMKDPNAKNNSMILAKTRAQEFQAFSEWIKSCCADESLKKSPGLSSKDLARPEKPVEVIRHSRKDRLLESFEQTIWAMRFRCMNCHTDGHPNSMKLQKEHGDRVIWFKKTPAQTMEYILNKTKLINMEDPAKSLLLLKPLNEVKHGGGVKFLQGDLGYQAFRTWIEDYVRIQRGDYKTAADLPKETNHTAVFGSELWFKITNTPDDWADKLLRVNIYAWNEKARTWEKDPVGISDRKVWGKGKVWQHSINLLADKGSARESAWRKSGPSLPPGKYRVVVQVDRDGVLEKNWQATLKENSLAGTAEFEARWLPGYGQMTSVDGAKISH